MGIGVVELFTLMAFVLFVIGIVWLVRKAGKPSKASMRTTAERLAELESLKKAHQITEAEYERQRTAIISNI
jgi:hypothetical protein